MRNALPLLLLLLSLSLAACGADNPGNDSGVIADAGTSVDAGDMADAGTPDMGTPDAGGGDAGTPDMGVSTSGPIDAPALTWTWVPVPGSRCINNTPTGFGVNINPNSDKVLIFMMGGNACFNVGSCFVTVNLDGYGANKFAADQNMINGTLFDRTANENYFKDWSYIFFPYCSGDVFSGTIGTTTVEGSSYTFLGYRNVAQFLERIVPTFPNVTDVMLTGVSAGGFGAFINYDQVATAFGNNVSTTLIDDSGPPMGPGFLAPCLQQHWRTVWDMDEGPLAACPGCTDTSSSSDGRFMLEYVDYVLGKYPTRNFGLIESAQDETIRTFWGFGRFNCRDLHPGTVLPSYPGPQFQMGLEDLRDNVLSGFDNAKLYMPMGTRHVWLGDPPWTTTHYGVVLQDWMIDAIEDNASWANVP